MSRLTGPIKVKTKGKVLNCFFSSGHSPRNAQRIPSRETKSVRWKLRQIAPACLLPQIAALLLVSVASGDENGVMRKGLGTRIAPMILFKKFKGRIHNGVFELNSYHYIGGKNYQNCRSKEEIYCCDQGKKYKSYLVRWDEGISEQSDSVRMLSNYSELLYRSGNLDLSNIQGKKAVIMVTVP